MIELSKTAFDHNFNMLKSLHEQAVKVVHKFQEKSPFFPEEGKKVINGWGNIYQQCCDDCKNIANSNFTKANDFFSEGKQPLILENVCVEISIFPAKTDGGLTGKLNLKTYYQKRRRICPHMNINAKAVKKNFY